MSGVAPIGGSFRATVPLYGCADVAWWFAQVGWDVGAIDGGHYVLRSPRGELVVRLRQRDRDVEVWGTLADIPVDGPLIAEMLSEKSIFFRAWWWDSAGTELGGSFQESMAIGTQEQNLAPPGWRASAEVRHLPPTPGVLTSRR